MDRYHLFSLQNLRSKYYFKSNDGSKLIPIRLNVGTYLFLPQGEPEDIHNWTRELSQIGMLQVHLLFFDRVFSFMDWGLNFVDEPIIHQGHARRT